MRRQLSMTLAAFAAISITFASLSAAIDDLDRPTQPGGIGGLSFKTPFGTDDVSPSSGALGVVIPIGPRYAVSSTLSYQLSISYSSSLWSYSPGALQAYWCPPGTDPSKCGTATFPYVTAELSTDFNGGTGWHFGLGRLDKPNSTNNPTSAWVYVDPSGGRHKFFDNLHQLEDDGSSTYLYTRDGTYMRLRKSGSGLPSQIEMADGTAHVFDSSGRLTTMQDRFGNAVTISYTSNTWTINDGIRTHTIHFTTYDGVSVVHAIDLAAFNGTTAEYLFNYSSKNLRRTCFDSDPSNDNSSGDETTLSAGFLSSIQGPESASWSFGSYNLGGKRNSQNCPLAGVLQQMTYPTGGSVAWVYDWWHFPAQGAQYIDYAPGVVSRTTSSPYAADPSGTWSLSPHLHPASNPYELWTDVTDPDNVDTTYYTYLPTPPQSGKIDNRFGLPTSDMGPIQDAQGNDLLWLSQRTRDPDGTVVKEVWLDFDHDHISSGDAGSDRILKNRRVHRTRVVFPNDGGRYIDTELGDFDGLGHYRTATVTDSWGSAPARTSVTDWNAGRGTYDQSGSTFVPIATSDPWILQTYDATTEEQNGVVAKQEYTFDGTTGVLQEQRVLRDFGIGGSDPLPSNHDLMTATCLNGAGSISSVRQYGGDLQDLSSVTVNCSGNDGAAFRTDYETEYGIVSRAYPVDSSGTFIGYNQYTAAVDRNTGLGARRCDSSGLCQNFSYDGLERPTLAWSDAGPGARATVAYSYSVDSSSEGGWTTQVNYSCPQGTTNCNTADFLQTKSVLDGFGRAYKSLVQNPDSNFSKQFIQFDGAGNVVRQSGWEPASLADSAAIFTTFGNFDAFGRAGMTTLPDGHVLTQDFIGIRVHIRHTPVAMSLSGAESVVETTDIYDRNGRLTEVDEPAVANGTTSAIYSYDILGNLSQIQHSAGLTSQQRTWSYDGRGFLTRVMIPEQSSPVLVGSYNALGDPGSQDTGTAGLRYIYDSAGRITDVWDLVSGQLVPLKHFTYDTANGYGVGKLATAENWTRYSGANLEEADVLQAYTYSGVGGAPSALATTVKLDGVVAASTTQGFTWNEAGALAAESYPTGMTANDPARTVSMQYTKGFLTAVPGYASALTYRDDETLASIAHVNGVTDVIGADPSRMGRPSSISTTGVANSDNWATGTYQYDGSGNIKTIGGNHFRYDAVSRLVEAGLWIPESNPQATSFTDGFDAGNACNWDTRAPDPGGCPSGIQQLGNESYAYDGYGNLTSRTTTTSSGATTLNTGTDSQTNHLWSASYDDRGNTISWNGAAYDFDNLNRMTRMRNGTQDWLFAYDCNGDRVLRVSTGGSGEKRWTIRSLNGQVLREWIEMQGEAASWSRDWIYGGDGRALAAISPGGAGGEIDSYFTLDHLGTPRLATDFLGQRVSYHVYWPYGREATDPSQDNFGKKFTGQERDDYDESSAADDLDYLHARYSSSTVGRFLNIDPGAGWQQEPLSFNKYSYVGGNPIGRIDPTGNEWYYFVGEACASIDEKGNCDLPITGFNGGTEDAGNNKDPGSPPPTDPPPTDGPYGGGGPAGGSGTTGGIAPPNVVPPGTSWKFDNKDLLFFDCIGILGQWGEGDQNNSREAIGWRVDNGDGTYSYYYELGDFDNIPNSNVFPQGVPYSVHTHNVGKHDADPSPKDVLIANTNPGLTIYVISPQGGVYMYNPLNRRRYPTQSPPPSVQVLKPGWATGLPTSKQDACGNVQQGTLGNSG